VARRQRWHRSTVMLSLRERQTEAAAAVLLSPPFGPFWQSSKSGWWGWCRPARHNRSFFVRRPHG
jgi:predicted NUDIX family NTP pyrophosphohydrolase